MMRIVALGAASAFALSLAVPVAADPPREVHGSADAFATPDVALAWAVLRAPKEDDAAVVMGIECGMRERRAAGAVTWNEEDRRAHAGAPRIAREARIHGPPIGKLRDADFADLRRRKAFDDAWQPLRLARIRRVGFAEAPDM